MTNEEKLHLIDLHSQLAKFNELSPKVVLEALVNSIKIDNNNIKIYKELIAVTSSIWYNNHVIEKFKNKLESEL